MVVCAGVRAARSQTASLSPTSINFGSQPLGLISAVQVVTLTNTGSANLNLEGFTVTGANSGDFFVCLNGATAGAECTGPANTEYCGDFFLLNQLYPGESCTVGLAFDPGAAGGLSAALSFTDNAPGSPQTVTLNGVGTAPSFGQVPALTQIAVGADGATWGLNAAQQIFRYDPSHPASPWDLIPGALTHIAVGASGFVWGLNASGQVYRFDTNAQNWDLMPGTLTQIAVGSDGDVWGINKTGGFGQIYHFNPTTQNWQPIPGQPHADCSGF